MKFQRRHSDKVQIIALVAGWVAVYVTILQTIGQFKLENHKIDGWAASAAGLTSKYFLVFVVLIPMVGAVVWLLGRAHQTGRLGGGREYVYGIVRIALALRRQVASIFIGVVSIGFSIVVLILAFVMFRLAGLVPF